MEQSALRAHSSSVKGCKKMEINQEESVTKIQKYQPFIKEVLSSVYNVSKSYLLHIMYAGYLILLFWTRTPFSKIYDTLEICKDVLTCTAEQFFDLLLADGSNFTNEYRAAGKDFNINVSPTFH